MIRKNAIVCLLAFCCLFLSTPAQADVYTAPVNFNTRFPHCHPLDFSPKGVSYRLYCSDMTCKTEELVSTEYGAKLVMQLPVGFHEVYLEIKVPDSQKVLGLCKFTVEVSRIKMMSRHPAYIYKKSDISVNNCKFRAWVDEFRGDRFRVEATIFK